MPTPSKENKKRIDLAGDGVVGGSASVVQEKRRDWTDVIIVLAVSPVYFVFLYLGKEDIGRTASLVWGSRCSRSNYAGV